MRVEPVAGKPAAVATTQDGPDAERALVVADYHAGLEVGLRRDGVEIPNRADERRDRILKLLERTRADRLVVLGDLGNAIGAPDEEERDEVVALLAAVTERVPCTVVKGNHDGDVESLVARAGVGDAPDAQDLIVTPAAGARVGEVGFAHGHTWPAPSVLSAPVVCVAHEHPRVRLEDEVGGTRTERAWLRGRLVADPFEDHHGRELSTPPGPELVVFPAFNDHVGGTWVNADSDFLSPFLPAALGEGEAYLLDGTRLGRYDGV